MVATSTLCPILFFVDYHDGIFPLLWRLPPSRYKRRYIEQTPSGPTAFPFANERMASDSSCILELNSSRHVLGPPVKAFNIDTTRYTVLQKRYGNI